LRRYESILNFNPKIKGILTTDWRNKKLGFVNFIFIFRRE